MLKDTSKSQSVRLEPATPVTGCPLKPPGWWFENAERPTQHTTITQFDSWVHFAWMEFNEQASKTHDIVLCCTKHRTAPVSKWVISTY